MNKKKVMLGDIVIPLSVMALAALISGALGIFFTEDTDWPLASIIVGLSISTMASIIDRMTR